MQADYDSFRTYLDSSRHSGDPAPLAPAAVAQSESSDTPTSFVARGLSRNAPPLAPAQPEPPPAAKDGASHPMRYSQALADYLVYGRACHVAMLVARSNMSVGECANLIGQSGDAQQWKLDNGSQLAKHAAGRVYEFCFGKAPASLVRDRVGNPITGTQEELLAQGIHMRKKVQAGTSKVVPAPAPTRTGNVYKCPACGCWSSWCKMLTHVKTCCPEEAKAGRITMSQLCVPRGQLPVSKAISKEGKKNKSKEKKARREENKSRRAEAVMQMSLATCTDSEPDPEMRNPPLSKRDRRRIRRAAQKEPWNDSVASGTDSEPDPEMRNPSVSRRERSEMNKEAGRFFRTLANQWPPVDDALEEEPPSFDSGGLHAGNEEECFGEEGWGTLHGNEEEWDGEEGWEEWDEEEEQQQQEVLRDEYVYGQGNYDDAFE